ncbi:MAG: ACT domain-containing protein [Erysipelotrichaceae bacterium]|nr:ACT domain-containing protein [Erysipelotrichaceae bacterium]
MNNYYIVSSNILSEQLEKVLEVRKLLHSGTVRDISAACKQVGISRGTYYKYKDAVYEFEDKNVRKASLSLILEDQKGSLLKVLQVLTSYPVNIVTINQNVPVNGLANISITIDISEMHRDLHTLIDDLKKLKNLKRAELIAME